MNAKDVQNFDEVTTMMANSFPPYWWKLYSNLVKEGFSESQAMDLLKTYIAVGARHE